MTLSLFAWKSGLSSGRDSESLDASPGPRYTSGVSDEKRNGPRAARAEKDQRYAPAASAELLAPSRRKEQLRERRRRRHPGKPGPLSLAKTEEVVAASLASLTNGQTPAQVAIATGTSTDGRKVREVIRTARELMQRNVQRYVELHLSAAEVAAAEGDAGPAQWALERIAEGNDRVVDPPKGGGLQTPSLRIGIAVAGVPAARAVESAPVTAAELPPLEADVVSDVVPEDLQP